MRKYQIFTGLILFLGLVILAEYLYLSKTPNPPESKNVSFELLGHQKYWTDLIAQKGPEEAFNDFKTQNAMNENSQQHLTAHVFGEALYVARGVSGITICDSSFGFGCFHQFFLSAIADQGLNVVHKLDEVCIQKFGSGGQGCQHGIGHGVFEYLAQSVPKALEVCAGLQWQEPLFGCQSGVFMEYNFPTFIDAKGNRAASREFDKNNPYQPCLTVAERFRLACNYAQPEWWDKSIHLGYEEIGKLCQAIKRADLRMICFKGIGSSLASSTAFSIDKSVAACLKMPNMDSQIYCRSGIYWGFWDDGTINREKAPQACQDLSPDQSNKCIKEGDLPEEQHNSIT